jgi:hypothetical protein
MTWVNHSLDRQNNFIAALKRNELPGIPFLRHSSVTVDLK